MMNRAGQHFLLYIVVCCAALTLLCGIIPPLCGSASAQTNQTAVSTADTLYVGLEYAVRLAIENNEDVKIALEIYERARGQKKEAYSAALPYVTAMGGYTRNIQRPVLFFPNPDTDEIMKIEIGEKNEFIGAFSLTQPLYAFGRIGGAIKAADYFLRSEEQNILTAEKQVAFEVKDAYYGALVAKEVWDIALLSLEQVEREFEEVRLKYRRDMAARFDSLRAEVNVKNRQPIVIEAENSYNVALLELKRITGIDRLTPIALTDPLEYIPEILSKEASIEEALTTRPDLAAMRLRVSMSDKLLNVTKRNNWPFLALGSDYLIQGVNSESFFPTSEKVAKSFSVGLSLTFPIFDGLANRGRIQQARADLGIARYSLQKMENIVELQVARLYDELLAAERMLRSQEATVDMAEESYRLALVRYRGGLSTTLELSDAELALNEARLNYTRAVYACIITLKTLESAMGR